MSSLDFHNMMYERHDNPNEEEQQQQQRIVFRTLDPILRLLLASMEQETQIIQTMMHNNTDPDRTIDHKAAMIQRRLSWVQSQTKLLQQLGQTIRHMTNNDDPATTTSAATGTITGRTHNHNTVTPTTTGLIVMAEYIFLPLHLVMQPQQPPQEQEVRNNDTHNDNSHSKNVRQEVSELVRQSAERARIEAAASVMVSFLHAVSPMMPSSSKKKEGATSSYHDTRHVATLSSTLVIRSLVACAMAMPLNDTKDDDSPLSSHNDTTTTTTPSNHALDKGESMMESILKCIQALVSCDAVTTTTTSANHDGAPTNTRTTGETTPSTKMTRTVANSLADEIAGSMKGGLVARLVQCCLDPLQQQQTKQQGNHHHKGQQDVRGNVGLQLQALSTLQSLLYHIPNVELWRALLPGCFSGLYRLTMSQLRFSTAQSSPKLAAEGFQTLARLLSLTLNNGSNGGEGNGHHDNDRNVPVVSSKDDPMAAVGAALAAAAIASRNVDPLSVTNQKGNKMPRDHDSEQILFLEQVNQRLPAPLSILMHLVVSNKSPSVRSSGCALCRSVLIDARSSWTLANVKKLSDSSTECCLGLLWDDNEKVAESAHGVLCDYSTYLEDEQHAAIGNTIVTRLVDIIEELPALARSGREVELRSKMRLVTGYLSLGIRSSRRGRRPTNAPTIHFARESDMAASLATDTVARIIQKSFSELLDVDFDSITNSPQIMHMALMNENVLASLDQPDFRRFVHLRETASIKAVKLMIRMFGLALGQKRAAMFIDGCIADVFEACTESSEAASSNFVTIGHVGWLHRWAGTILVAHEVLIGSFCEDRRATFEAVGNVALHLAGIIATTSEKEERTRKKALHALVSALVPIIFSAPLWDLPTTFMVQSTPSKVDGKSLVIGHSSTFANESREWRPIQIGNVRSDHNIRRTIESEIHVEISVTALNGNATIICSIMALIDVMTDMMGIQISEFLPIMLYPLFEKAGYSNHSHVQQTALQTLHGISRATEHESISSLVHQNFDYLLGTMNSKLRAHVSSQNTLHEMPGVVEIVLLNAARIGGSNDDRESQARLRLDNSNVSLLADLILKLMTLFEKSNGGRYNASAEKYDTVSSLGLVRVFNSAMKYLQQLQGTTTLPSITSSNHKTEGKYREDDTQPWLTLLDQFCDHTPIQAGIGDAQLDPLTPEEGFKKYHDAKGNENSDDMPQNDGEQIPSSQMSSADMFLGRIELVQKMVAQSCFLLSMPDLKIQVASCDALTLGFNCLFNISKLTSTLPASDSSRGDPLLMSISDSWPSIMARFRSTASASMESHQPLSLRLDTDPAKIESLDWDRVRVSQEIFLAKIVSLIALLCEVSGDFMVSRMVNEAWPIFSELINHHSRQWTNEQSTKNKNNASTELTPRLGKKHIVDKSGPQSRKNGVLEPLVRSIARVFAAEKCGSGLSNLTPLAGNLILPLLSDEGTIGAAAMDALRSLLAIDCDCMWRALLTVSGQSLPQRRLRPVKCASRSAWNISIQPLLASRAKELIAFVDNLPEQAVY